MAMKFGFEHDAFSSDEEDDRNVPSEQTPLLANSNVAPTADPTVAEVTTGQRSSTSSTHEEWTRRESRISTQTSTKFSREQDERNSSSVTTDATTKISDNQAGIASSNHSDNVSTNALISQSERDYLHTAGDASAKASTDHSERSSTITGSTAAQPSTDRHGISSEKPLPVKQMLILCFARAIEPIAFFSIFPYINQMCVRNGNIPPSDTGFYAGVIESLFSLTQMCVMIIWGRLADHYGRKPILVISLFGIAFATAIFGLAQTIWQMILFRCIAGVFAGTVVTIRTMITEHSTPKTQARAFSWFAFAGNLGILFGPLAGGALADPNKQFPNAFRHVPFFDRFPYALASFFTGSLALIAAILTAVLAEETMQPRKAAGHKSNTDPESAANTPEEDTSTLTLLKAPGVLAVLYLYGHCTLLGYAYTAVVPVFMFEPISLGGFGFSSFYISIFMALIGASQAIWLLLIFPPLQHKIGTGSVLRLCSYVWPVMFFIHPLLNLLLRQHTEVATTMFWIFTPIVLCLGVGISMAFTAVQLALNDISPSPRTLGTLNALALTLISGLRAVGPAAFASILAVGVRNQIMWGYLVWFVLIILALGFTLGMRLLPEKAEGRIYEEIEQERT